MKILYVYAHPNVHSFNEELKQQAFSVLRTDHELTLSDLYAQHFNAIASWDDFTSPAQTMSTQYFSAQLQAYNNHLLTADIQNELNKIKAADHIVFQFPLWWFSLPAILKGWFDRNWVKGFAYDTGKIFKEGLLQGKTASLIITTQSPESAYQTDGIHQAKLETFLHPIYHTLRFVGISPLHPFIINAAFNMEKSQQQLIFTRLKEYLLSLESHRNQALKK